MVKKSFYFILFLIIGLIIFFYHSAVTGFDLMPGNAGDAALSNYILEHFWQWLNQIPQHQSFWDMPFYYPNENTLAYSDVMLGGALIYVPLRCFVKNPFTAFQIWLVLLCFVNYICFYFLLRRFKYSDLSSALGTFLFAFGVMRYFKMYHPNYYIQYPMILSLICLSFANKHKHLAILGFFTFLSLQFWSVYTIGYFFCFTAFIAVCVSLFFKDTRELIINFVRGYYKELVLYGFIFIDSLIPLACHYLMLETVRSWSEVFYHFTDFTIWFRNISITDDVILRYLPTITEHSEICGGIGIITMLLAVCGLWKFEKYRKQIFITLIFLMLLCVKYGTNSPWYIVYKCFPGADGIRVVSRIYFIFLVFYCFGIAEFFKKVNKKTLVLLCTLLLLIEQIPSAKYTYLWSKNSYLNYVTQKADNVPKNCRVLYYQNLNNIGVLDVLVMWIANFSNTYSANGSSGVVKEKIWQDNSGYCLLDIEY